MWRSETPWGVGDHGSDVMRELFFMWGLLGPHCWGLVPLICYVVYLGVYARYPRWAVIDSPNHGTTARSDCERQGGLQVGFLGMEIAARQYLHYDPKDNWVLGPWGTLVVVVYHC